jgi:membrane protein
MTLRNFFQLCKNAAVAWNDDKAPQLGAAIAYYTLFSLAPLLLIAIGMASLIVGEDAARSGIVEQLRQNLGGATADAIASLLENAHHTGHGLVATLVGLVVLLFGASGVFVQLQEALNTIWKTESQAPLGNSFVLFFRRRLFSLGAVILLGFLLLLSLLLSSVLTAMSHWLTAAPLLGEVMLWRGLSLLASFGLATLLFALIFKLLPDTPVAWRDVWIGALLTAVLFHLGQHAIGLYLGRSGVASAFGAAGSLVAFIVWVYYSAQIVLFGAEFTFAFASAHGSRRPPKSEAAEAAPQRN